MRFPDTLLNSVCFLSEWVDDQGRKVRHYGGTAFFISVPSETRPSIKHPYLVTARHNVIDNNAVTRDISLRVNTEDGKSQFIEVDGNWLFPDDSAIDVAIIPFPIQQDDPTTIVAFEPSMFITEEKALETNLGVGDDIVVAGMFTEHVGTHRNLPVIRKGIIAAMPAEPLVDRNNLAYDGYIVELLSLAGLSGSPVFVMKYTIAPRLTMQIQYHLLGLISKHWDDESQMFPNLGDSNSVNMGMAIVVPAQGILDLLHDEGEVRRRRIDAGTL
jgi:hypothetical protein